MSTCFVHGHSQAGVVNSSDKNRTSYVYVSFIVLFNIKVEGEFELL